MVQLYLIRHAIAEERGDAWPDDTLRPLTDEGRARMRKVAKGLVRLGVKLDVILTSPLVRARQTAELVGAAFDGQPPILELPQLEPGTPYTELLDGLRKYARKKRVALVGHEPDLGIVASRLLGTKKPIAFRKGGACLIEVGSLPPSTPGSLRWLATPAMLRAIHK